MVHRPPDSRLLTNLIDHEKEYGRQLTSLFPLAHAALASLSAYAAASPPSAQAISGVVDALASADDALQRYTHAIDAWRNQLVALKDLEDDLAAVLRDRDILVTRLIKASKSTREAHRSSRLVVPPLTSLGSASFISLPSTSSTVASNPASTSSKLAQAQTELQACETHLMTKERELDARRIALARDGLGARCRALIDCGWIWGEMGKQGLRALKTLSPDGSSQPATAKLSHLTANLPTYVSDSSSLTPSQSASQTAAMSVETSHEGSSKRAQPEQETQADGDLTISLPPAHAISELTLPTTVRAPPRPLENGADPTPKPDETASTSTSTSTQPASRRKRAKRPHRPPSQHILEVSDEGTDDDAAANAKPNGSATPRAPRLKAFPTTTTPVDDAQDSTSDEEHPSGSLQVVENDPFEVIRRSMLGPSAPSSQLLTPAVPTARASAPDVRASAAFDTSPVKVTFPGSVFSPVGPRDLPLASPTSVSPSGAGRQRRTSMAFFGSLRGLFRKTREREKVAAWEEGHSPHSQSPSPSPSLPTRSKTGTRSRGGWVTRTDVRIKKGSSRADSDNEATPKSGGVMINTTTITTSAAAAVVNVGRSASGARLRKGRPARAPSQRVGADGWVTDSPGAAARGASVDVAAEAGRSDARRGTIRRKKTSVADLRGSDQGHTDGEVDRPRRSLERHSSGSALGKAPAAQGEDATCASGNALASSSSPTRRATTTATTATIGRRPSADVAAPTLHRRSASLSFVDAHAVGVSTFDQGQTPAAGLQGMSWRKPPPLVESTPAPVSASVSVLQSSSPRSRSQSPSPSRIPSPSTPPVPATAPTAPQAPKPSVGTHANANTNVNARRQLGNGHVRHAHNQSLMSIVADVTDVSGKARSLDIPRAPGSVLREREVVLGAERGVNGQGHARVGSEPQGQAKVEGQEQGQGRRQGQGQGQRAVKTQMPLRSALRNASRTPSPSPMGVAPVVPPPAVVVRKECDRARGGGVSPTWRDSASVSSYETVRESWDTEEMVLVHVQAQAQSRTQQSQSKRRSFVQSDLQPPATKTIATTTTTTGRSQTPSPPPPTLSFTFPPPPVDPPPARSGTTSMNTDATVNGNVDGYAHSNGNPSAPPIPNANGTEGPPSSNVSTETPPPRRKSVRVSLEPTFSPSPPVLLDDDDDDGDGGSYAPWSGAFGEERGRGRTKGERRRSGASVNEDMRAKRESGHVKASSTGAVDVWADSSEEDETYAHARRLLNLAGGRR